MEKVYAGTEGLVTNSVLSKWLKEIDTTKAKAMMNTHVKSSTKVSTFRDRKGGKGKGEEQKEGMVRSWRKQRGYTLDQQRGKDAPLDRQGAPAVRPHDIYAADATPQQLE
ncbi:hypothetical protein CYMTET_49400 [Cymbomonas tetramitiformis]|uniref:Uncharacterized protein n=1 Tax=Cymbomonas tetramitiformis TaxID=36881 RepID=A0AAE0BQC7_9CHLO|nr:hypothetical protein CYMTET_49400 [Cymbomonas tetramitiformis]